MDLKTRKYIKNTNSLPGYQNGLGGGVTSSDLTGGYYPRPVTSYRPGYTPSFDFSADDPGDMSGADFTAALKRNSATLPGAIQSANSLPTTSTNPSELNIEAPDLPTDFSGGAKKASITGGQIAQAGVGTLLLAGQLFANSKATIDPQEMLLKYGTNNNNSIDGIRYQLQNDINISQEMSNVSAETTANTVQSMGMGASAGAAFGPVGAAVGAGVGLIGGLFSGAARRRAERRRLRAAQRRADNINDYNRTQALTQSVQMKQAERYGNSEEQSLYSAAYGSEGVNPATNETYKKFLVQTPNGKKYAKQNAWLDAGEYVEDARTGASYKVKGDSRKTDSVRGRVNDNTRIASKRVVIDDTTGATTADLFPKAKAEGWTDELFEMLRMKKGMMAAAYGAEGLPGYENGGEGKKRSWLKGFGNYLGNNWENIAATAPGLIMSVGDLIKSKSDSPMYTDEMPYNKYEGKVANIMAGRRGNFYPISQQLASQAAQDRYRLRGSGGLSTAQRVLGNIMNVHGTQQARANALLNIQQMNNAYAKENADMLNQMGTHLMTAREQARQFNTQMNNAAHASWIQNQQMAQRNILDYVTQFAKNSWEKKMFDRNYALYAADVKNKENYYNWLMGKGNDKETSKTSTTNSLSGVYGNTFQASKTVTGDGPLVGLRKYPQLQEQKVPAGLMWDVTKKPWKWGKLALDPKYNFNLWSLSLQRQTPSVKTLSKTPFYFKYADTFAS